MVNPSVDLYNKQHAISTKQIAKLILRLNNGKTARAMYRESGKFNNINNQIVWGCVNQTQLKDTGIILPLVINTGTSPHISFLSANVFNPLLLVASVNNLEGIFNNELNTAYQEAIKHNASTVCVKFDLQKYSSILGPDYDNIFKAVDFTLFIKH